MSAHAKYIVLALVLITLLGLGLYFAFTRPSSIEVKNPEPQGSAAPTSTTAAAQTPRVVIGVKDKSTIVIQWENLPGDAALLNIFRTTVGKNQWAKWQTVQTGGGGAGAIEIALGRGDNPNLYSYYFQTVSTSGGTLSNSPSGQLSSPGGFNQSAPPGQSPPGGSPIGTGFNFSNFVTLEAPSSTPPPSNQYNLSNLTTSTPPPPPGDQYNQSNLTTWSGLATGTVTITAQGTYYSPQGVPSGLGSQEAAFWVLHVNQSIEVGWQNLPANADRVVVYRSLSSNGPWLEILEQTNINPSIPSYIRLVDSTIAQGYHYQMEARSGNTVLQTYGPVLLPPLGS